MTDRRYKHTVTLLPNGQVLVAGGSSGTDYVATADLFNPATGTFSRTMCNIAPERSNMARGRYLHTATLLLNGRVLIAGGYNNVDSFADAALYSGGCFTPTGNMTIGRFLHAATLLLNGKVLITGGRFDIGGQSGIYQASAELYDPSLGTFSRTTGDMATARYEHGATLLPTGHVLITGGFNGASLASPELYHPSPSTFSCAGSMGSVRSEHRATLLFNGKVLITGGGSGSNALANAELFSPF